MGGEVWLLMNSRDDLLEARCFLESIFPEKGYTGELISIAPKLDDYTPADCWIEFKRNRIEVGHTVHFFNSKWAMAVACGIRDHFNVRKGGWDDGGYSPEFWTTRPFRVDMNMVERVIDKGEGNFGGLISSSFNEDLAAYKRYRKIYEARIDKLFEPLKARRKPKPKHVPEKAGDPL